MYGKPYVVATGTNSDIDTDEEDVVSVTDLNLMDKSQFTCYLDYVLGTHTSMQIRFFYRNQVGGDWYQLPQQNTGDNTLDEGLWIIDGNSPASRLVIEFPVGAAYAMKLTAKGVGGANGTLTAKILTRNN